MGSTGWLYPAGQTSWQRGGVGFDAPISLLLAVNTDAADLELVVSKRDGGEVLARLKVEEGWRLAVGSDKSATFEIESYSVVTAAVRALAPALPYAAPERHARVPRAGGEGGGGGAHALARFARPAVDRLRCAR